MLVMHRRCRASEMVDLVDLQEQGLHNVMADELEPMVTKVMLHILFPPSEQIIHHNDMVTSSHELVHKMAANEPRTSCHHDPQRLALQP